MQEKDKAELMYAVQYQTLYKVIPYFNPPDKLKLDDESFFDYDLLKVALERRHQTIVNFLLKHGCRVRNPHKTTAEETPLHLAMKLGNNPIIRKILSSGASIYDKNPNGETALHAAFKEERNISVDAFLHFFSSTNVKQIRSWKRLNPADEDDIIHFHIACVRNNVKAVKRYLSSGFDVNTPFRLDTPELSGLNPCQYAIMKNNRDLFCKFLRYNADLSIKNGDGHTLMQMIYYSNFSDPKFLISQIFRLGNDTKFTNYADENGLTHFHLCCIIGDPKIVQVFIDKEVDVNSAISWNCPINPGFTSLHFAVTYGCEKVVLLLLEYGADCNIKDKNDSTPLHIACKQSRPKNNLVIKMLLYYNACPSITDKSKLTPLLIAFNNSWHTLATSIYDMLIAKIPRKVNYTDDQNLSHWHIVCTRNDVSRVVDFLESGVPVDSCVTSGKYSGYTALHFAALYNQKDVVEVLLKWNAKVNVATSESKLTPLHLACNYNHMKYNYNSALYDNIYNSTSHHNLITDIVWKSDLKSQLDIIKLLLEHEADIDAQDSLGNTPLLQAFTFDYCNLRMKSEIGIILKDIIKILVAKKANLNACTNKGKSVLHIISQHYSLDNSDELAEFLISKGAKVNLFDEAGLTPLHVAANYKKRKLIKILLKHKADVNAKSVNGKNPLQLFLSFDLFENEKDILLAFLESGSDVNVRNADGIPLWLEILRFHKTFILEMFLNYGADINTKDSSGQPLIVRTLRKWACNTAEWETTTNAAIFRIIDHHLRKLENINRYVNNEVQKYHQMLIRHFSETTEIYKSSTFTQDSNEELSRMKLVKIDNYTSMYDILLKDVHELSKHVKNDTLVKILEDENTYNTFPLYSYLLKIQFKKALIRSSVLESAKESLSFVIGLNLPDLCYDSIFKYFTNTEIDNIKAAVPLAVRIRIFRKRQINNDCNQMQPPAKLQKKK